MSVDDLQAFNFARLSDQLLTLLTDPTSNLSAALILYGIIGLLVLIVLVVGIVVLMGLPDDEVQEAVVRPEPAQPPDTEQVDGMPQMQAGADGIPAPPGRTRLVTVAVVVGIVAAAWVMSGFTTSTDVICAACHVDNVHGTSESGPNPHESTACVSCHEPTGVVGRYVSGVPARMLHFVDGATKLSSQPSYGRVASSACSRCHAKGIAGVTVNPVSGVRMSHAEPLAASARCLDCHEPIDGVVSRQTVGMGSCLRCHDSVTASSACSMCHDKQTAAAARARTKAFAKAQVADVKCGGCHDEKKECDSCHGMRMPHTLAFKAGAHARAGAVDFWYNGGRTCAGCHTARRRPCTKCHTPLLGKAHPINLATEHQGALAASCDGCHQAYANPRNRDFCSMCHNEAALRESPR